MRPGAPVEVGAPPGPAKTPPFAKAFFPQFEEVEAVLDRFPGFALLPVEVPSRDVTVAFLGYLHARGRRMQVVGSSEQWRILPAAIVANPPGPDGVTLVLEPAEMDADVRAALRLLNQRRDTIIQHLGAPLLWCGSADLFRVTAELAPDFWSVREIPLRIVVPAGFAGTAVVQDALGHIDELSSSADARSSTSMVRELDALREHLFSEPATEGHHAAARALLLWAPVGSIDTKTADRMVQVFRAKNERRDLARALEVAAASRARGGDIGAAEAEYREACQLFERLDDRAGKARCASRLGHLLRASGRHAEAERVLVEGLDLARQIDDWYVEAACARPLAMVKLADGEVGQARELLKIAYRRAGQLRDPHLIGTTCLAECAVLASAADFEAARRKAVEAAKCYAEAGLLASQARALGALAHTEIAAGHLEAALAALKRAVELLIPESDVVELQRYVEHARQLPPEIAPDRDAFIAATEAHIAALRSGAVAPEDPVK